MAQYVLYVDCDADGDGSLVSGPSNPAVVSFPRLTLGDTPNFNIYLLRRTPTYPLSTPFSVISVSALSLKVGIGPKDGLAGSTLLTQQFTWAKDAGNQYFTASLPLNTAGLNALVGSATTGSSWFEIEFTEGGFPTTPFSKQVPIQGEVLETAALIVPAGATAISAEEVNGNFLKKTNTGFVLQCTTDPTVQAYVYLGADGVLHADPIT